MFPFLALNNAVAAFTQYLCMEPTSQLAIGNTDQFNPSESSIQSWMRLDFDKGIPTFSVLCDIFFSLGNEFGLTVFDSMPRILDNIPIRYLLYRLSTGFHLGFPHSISTVFSTAST